MKVFLDVITVYNQLTLHKGHFPESSWWVSANQLKSFKNRAEDSLGGGGRYFICGLQHQFLPQKPQPAVPDSLSSNSQTCLISPHSLEGNIPCNKNVLHTHILLATYLTMYPTVRFSAGTMTDTDTGQRKILKDDDHKLPKFGEKH